MQNPRRGASSAPANTGGGNFVRSHYFSLKPGEKRIIRFLTDYEPEGDKGGLLLLKQHFNVPTIEAPSDYTGDKWPQRASAVCRRDPNLTDQFDSCIICDEIVPVHSDVRKAADRFWAVAAVRVQEWEDNRLVGVRDAKRTVVTKDAQGNEKETEELDLVVLNFSMNNFFGRLSAFYGLYGTLLDRDYQVERKGEGLKTEYEFAPLNPITLGDGRIFDLREADLMARYLPRATEVGYAAASDEYLFPIIEQQYDDRHYGRFFDSRLRSAITPAESEASEPVVTPAPAVANTPDEEAQIAALQERLRPAGETPPAPPGGLRDLG
jgi:hypothetical protein